MKQKKAVMQSGYLWNQSVCLIREEQKALKTKIGVNVPQGKS